MKFQVNDTEYQAHFINDPRRRIAVCVLHRGECAGRPCLDIDGGAVTIAQCSQKDPYRPETGQKLALARALEQAGMPRPERAMVWEQYHRKLHPKLVTVLNRGHVRHAHATITATLDRAVDKFLNRATGDRP